MYEVLRGSFSDYFGRERFNEELARAGGSVSDWPRDTTRDNACWRDYLLPSSDGQDVRTSWGCQLMSVCASELFGFGPVWGRMGVHHGIELCYRT